VVSGVLNNHFFGGSTPTRASITSGRLWNRNHPVLFIVKASQISSSDDMEQDLDEVDPVSPTFVCFTALAAFVQALLKPVKHRIRAGRTPSTSPRSV
jgi:hypothetical protein